MNGWNSNGRGELTRGMKNKKWAAVGAAVFGFFLASSPRGLAEDSPPAEKIGFDFLGGFDYVVKAPGPGGADSIPESVRALNGQRVELVGYAIPIDIDEKGIRSFALLKDQLSCCFGQAPRMNHWVYVTVKGKALREIGFEPIRVVGTLAVGEYYEEAYLICIYRLSADNVGKVVQR